MVMRRGKRVAWMVGVVVVVVLLVSGVASRERIVDEWHLRGLRSDDIGRRESALEYFHRRESRGAIPILISALNITCEEFAAHPDRESWGAATRYGTRSVISTMLHDLGEPATVQLILSLGRYGAEYNNYVTRMIAHVSGRRASSYQSTGSKSWDVLQTREVLTRLKYYDESTSRQVRQAAATALKTLHPPVPGPEDGGE